MGYYTGYKLSIVGDCYPNPKIEELRAFSDSAAYALEEDGSTNESCKWYDHEEDMRWFSSQYPNDVFVLEGEGEESGDLWRKYYKNGKEQVAKAKIAYDEFDETKLQ